MRDPRERLLPLSSLVLSVGGISLMGVGAYFLYFRPPLLPEDLRYMGTSAVQIEAQLPGLIEWLKRVFWVLGGYIFASGILTVHVALTGFRHRRRGAAMSAAFAGASSIGLMTAVNFMLASDFRWHLFALAMFWVVALVFYFFEKTRKQT